MRLAAKPGPGAEIDRHRAAGTRVGRRIDTATALERVRTETAGEDVVAAAAIQEIVVAVAHQAVGLARSEQVLDRREGIACRVTSTCGAGRKVDGHTGI